MPRRPLVRVAVLLAALALSACGGGGSSEAGAPAPGPAPAPAPEPAPAPVPAPPPAPTSLAITAISTASPTTGAWNKPLVVDYSFTVTNGGSTPSPAQQLYAGVFPTATLPVSWGREGGVFPIVEGDAMDRVDVPALAAGASVVLAGQATIGQQNQAWSLTGYLDACLYVPGTTEMTGCNAAPVTMAQIDPSSVVTPPPTAVAGYGGEYPHAAAALDTSPVAGATLMSGRFGWDRPGPFSWSPTLTDDQAWTFDAGGGVTVAITMPWATFIESTDISATAVTLAPADAARPLPFGTVLAALELAPADLQTEQAYTLRFSLSDTALAGVSPGELVAFGADSDGRNLRLLPLVPEAGGGYGTASLSVGLRHFGIVGLATMNAAQRDALAASWPRDADAQIEGALGASSATARAAALSAGGALRRSALARRSPLADEPVSPAIRTAMAYYNDVMVPAFVSAYGGQEPEIEAATRIGLGWLRQLALLGLDQVDPLAPLAADMWTRVNDLVDRHADKVKQKCVAGGGFVAFRNMLQDMRQLQLLGHDNKSQELAEALGACSSFTVQYEQSWADQNTNASLSGGVQGSLKLTAPTVNMIKTGSLPNGDGNLAWTSFQSTTTDTFTNYDANGNEIGSCTTTTTGTGTTGSQFTVYIKDYGLSFLKGGGHKAITVLLWPYGTYNGQTHIPMGIHQRVTSTCNGTSPSESDIGATPWINDPGLPDRGDGMRVGAAPWDGSAYTHTWSITRSGDLHPTHEQISLKVLADY
ncbi:MAG: hypothetical protein KF891_19350 [Rhizobacter sp.]|nr:hypothetical protein [Rhizobacter sp.]